MLVKASLELPGFATLDELAARIRHDVNTAMFERLGARIALPDRIVLEGLLDVDGPGAKSAFHRLKQDAGRASWSGFREQVVQLRWVESLGDRGVLACLAAQRPRRVAGAAPGTPGG